MNGRMVGMSGSAWMRTSGRMTRMRMSERMTRMRMSGRMTRMRTSGRMTRMRMSERMTRMRMSGRMTRMRIRMVSPLPLTLHTATTLRYCNDCALEVGKECSPDAADPPMFAVNAHTALQRQVGWEEGLILPSPSLSPPAPPPSA